MLFQIGYGCRIILAGRGVQAEQYRKFIDSFYSYYETTAIADDIAVQERMYLRGIKIMPFLKCRDSSGLVVLFGGQWPDLAKQLEREGMVFLRDYIPEWFFELAFRQTSVSFSRLSDYVGSQDLEPYFKAISYCKKIAVVYGDDTVPCLVRLLSRTREFCEDYVIVSLPPISALKRENKRIPEIFWKYVSLGIIQKQPDARAEHHIKDMLPGRAKTVTIPPFVFCGYFPQNEAVPGRFPSNRDRNIDKMAEQGITVEEMIQKLSADDYYTESEIKENVYKSFEYAASLEEGCDVGYLQYLKREFRNRKLFQTACMPGYELFRYMAIQILQILGYETPHINEKNLAWPDKGETAVYPSTAKGLVLNFCTYDQNTVTCNALEEYVRSYVSKYYPVQAALTAQAGRNEHG